MVHHRLGGRASVGVVLGATLLAAAGCASNSPSASKTPSGLAASTEQAPASSTAPSASGVSTSPSAPVDQNSPQAQVGLSTYRAMWADVVKVQATMNDKDGSISDHLTGDALTYFHGAIFINRQNGYTSTKGEPKLLHPQVTQVVGSGATLQVLVTDCVDDSGYTEYTSDGTLVKDGDPNGRRFTQALVVPSGGSYKVSKFAYSKAGTC